MRVDVPHARKRVTMASMKYVWKVVVPTAPEDADRRQGYALASSMGEALELAGLPDAVAIPQPGKTWPGTAQQVIHWSN